MTDKITLELTLDELKLIDKYVELNDETQSVFDKIKVAYPQPRMTLQQEGEYAVVSFNDKVYYRLYHFQGDVTFSWYIKKGVNVGYPVPTLMMVNDAETERLLEGLYYNHIQVKKEKEQRTKNPVKEAYKDWWGDYPELETDSQYDDTRWAGFQAGYEFAYQEKIMEKVQKEQEVEPSMTNCVITGNPPDGYVTWQEWYNELGSKGILHKLRISSIDYKPTPQDPEMLLMRQGKVDIVDYNHRTHYRIQYTDSFSGVYKWFVRKLGEIPFLEEVRDVNVYSPLEELYQKEVVKQKDDYPYKKYTPEETEQSLKEAFREAVKQGVVSSTKPQTLYDVIADWWDDTFTKKETSLQELVDAIEEWLPTEHDTNSYKWNECIRMIKSKLR